ncbi:MAG: S1C family serine protease [Planctomycetota bacterium]
MRIRTIATVLVIALSAAAAAAGFAPAVLADELADGLGALDAALPRVAERAERSVVALDVARDEKAPRSLTQREKMALGIGGGRVFDSRYFERPAGPCSAVVIRSNDQQAVLITSLWNVREGKSYSITLASGDKVSASLKGTDENMDVAVLVTDKPLTGIKAIEVAKEKRVGQYAILIGRGGERATPIVTVGNLSAVGRFKGDAIQVSTRMNYGNVGGAVVDLDGKLLGIAAKLTDRPYQGLNSGVGFAAPAERVLKHLDDLVAGKNAKKRKSPFLGIMLDPKLEQPKDGGVRINLARQGDVLLEGAAKKAGIKDGDIIKIFNGVEVKDFEQLRDCIEKLEVGEKVIVTIERGDLGEKDFTLELGERPEGEE